MAGLELRVTEDRITPALRKLGHLLGSLHTPLTEMGRNLVTSTRERFARSVGPTEALGGSPAPWAPLKPATIARRRKQSSKPLLDTTALMRSVQAKVHGNTLHVGTNHEIAAGISPAIHQLGGTSDMAPGPAGIPARPFLGVDAEDAAGLERVATEYLEALPVQL